MGILSPWSAQARSGGGAAAGAVNTLSLIHFDGIDEGTTFTDEVAGITWSPGNASLEATGVVFGSTLMQHNDSGGVSASGWTFDSTGDWTLEFWCRNPGVGGKNSGVYTVELTNSDFGTDGMHWTLNSTTTPQYIVQLTNAATTTFYNDTTAITDDGTTALHRAIVKEGDNYTTYNNGTRIQTVATTEDIRNGTHLRLIWGGSASSALTDEFRFSNVARYSGASFTVPSAAFTVD
ncbi:MAG: LamG domain-containing protein [Anaerolineae bacterium]|nr:LamG domain-containing protein [Anaerolineae bacterium]